MAGTLPEGTITILFTDLEGSTDLTARKGDRHARDLIRARTELVRRQIEEHSGREVKTMGDGFMVAFASARNAVACAVAIQRALDDHNRRLPGEMIRIRIGMNTGEAIEEEADLFGEAVNAAARIAARAKAGQILLSDSVRAVLGRNSDQQLVDRGRFTLKGLPDKWRLHEVVWQETKGPAPIRLERTPFVGREAECADLTPLLDRTARGHGTLILVGGEPGVGKSRLSEEMMAEARRRGFMTYTGHCFDAEGAAPYAPFLEILEHAARGTPAEAFRAALADDAADVGRVMPELRRIFPDIPSPLNVPPEQERRLLLKGMVAFIERCGRARPLALVLDDLHWADESTLVMLEHVAERLGDMPVLVVGTYRDAELDVQRPLAKTLALMVRHRLVHRVRLKRLPQDAVTAMLRALSAQEPPPALVDVIYRETEGNPFFVEEVYQHLAEEGRIFDSEGSWRRDLQVDEVDVPEGVRLVLGRRLQRISEEGRRALTSAAAIGPSFTFDLLQAMDDLDADALLDALDEAERARLIAPADDGLEARYSFAHELVRQTLLADVSLPRRQRLHVRVAEAIERTCAEDLERSAPELANHYFQAGAAADQGKAARYMTLAGKRALSAAAFEDALRHLDHALALRQEADTRERADLLYHHGLALRSVGRWGDVLADWRQALDLYEELGDADAIGHMTVDMAEALIWGAHFAEAVEVSSRGLAALGERENVDRCRILANMGSLLSVGGQFEVGQQMVERALRIAEKLGDPHLLGSVLGSNTLHHWSCMEAREAISCGLRSADLLRSSDDRWTLTDVLWQLGFALTTTRPGDVAGVVEELEPTATRVGNAGALVLGERVRLHTDLALTGDVARFRISARANLEHASQTGFAWSSNSTALIGMGEYWQGRWDEAVGQLQEAVRLEVPGFFVGGDSGLCFSVLASMGDERNAMALLEPKREHLPQSGKSNGWGAWTLLYAAVEGLAALGKRQEAADLYPLVVESLGTGALVRYPGAGTIQAVAGVAAACGERWDLAGEHFQTAIRQAHELPVVLGQPEARRWYARMLLDRDAPGDREKAHTLLTEAIELYRAIGMPKHVEMAEALLN
jgi:class 3 adenylate cyclase/tetratricopeptide (TPR) repeat protein